MNIDRLEACAAFGIMTQLSRNTPEQFITNRSRSVLIAIVYRNLKRLIAIAKAIALATTSLNEMPKKHRKGQRDIKTGPFTGAPFHSN
jgi:hypothetical protein